MSRRLDWEGCVNVRDLGGLPIEDDGATLWRAVVRADNVRHLTDAGWQALSDYGVRTVVDLRFHEDLAEDPPSDLPVDVVHVPVLDLDLGYRQEIETRERDAPDWAVHTRDIYLEFLDRHQSRFAQAVAAVGDAGAGAVCVHCFAGKDRTGLVSALLLRLAGVSVEVVADDYAESELNVERLIEPWAAQAPDEAERRRRLRHARTPREAMRDVIVEVERRHGTVRNFLESGGAADDALARARTRLRGTNGAA